MGINTTLDKCWIAISYGTTTGTGSWFINKNRYYVESWLIHRKKGVNKGGRMFQGFHQVAQLLAQDLEPGERHQLQYLDNWVRKYKKLDLKAAGIE